MEEKKIILNNFIKAIISTIKGGQELLNNVENLVKDFSHASLSEIQEGFTESIKTIKAGVISLIKDKSNFKNSDAILTWTDYFIKGTKICSNISEAETLSQALVENNIILIDGQLNKKKI